MDVKQAKAELRECLFLTLEIENVKEIIDEIIKRKMEKLGMQAMKLTDMPSGGGCNNDKILNTLQAVEELELEKRIRENNEKILLVRSKINSLELPEERLILRMKYLQNKTFEEIRKEINYSIRRTQWMHGQALKSYSLLE